MLQALSIESLRETLIAKERQRDARLLIARNTLSPRAEMFVADLLQRLSGIASEQLACAVNLQLADRSAQEDVTTSIGTEPLRVLFSIFDEPLELLISQELSQELARAVLHQEPGVVLGASSAEIRTAVSFLAVSILTARAHYAGQRVFLSSVESVSGDLLTSFLGSAQGTVIEVAVVLGASRYRLFIKIPLGLAERLRYHARLCARSPSGKLALVTETFSAKLQLQAKVGSALSLLTLRPGSLLSPTQFSLILGRSGCRLSGVLEGGAFEVGDDSSGTKLENGFRETAVLRLRCRT